MNTPRTGWSLAGAVAAAIAASICCLAPLFAVALGVGAGVGGAWATRVSALEPHRPVLIGLALVVVALAFYRAQRARCPDGSCGGGASRASLWIVAPLVLAILAVPYVTPYLASAKGNDPARVTAPGGNDACCPVPTQNGAE